MPVALGRVCCTGGHWPWLSFIGHRVQPESLSETNQSNAPVVRPVGRAPRSWRTAATAAVPSTPPSTHADGTVSIGTSPPGCGHKLSSPLAHSPLATHRSSQQVCSVAFGAGWSRHSCFGLFGHCFGSVLASKLSYCRGFRRLSGPKFGWWPHDVKRQRNVAST